MRILQVVHGYPPRFNAGSEVYTRTTGIFHIYMDKVLHNMKIKRSLLQEFELPKRSTQFLTDAHYPTDGAELEKLFS